MKTQQHTQHAFIFLIVAIFALTAIGAVSAAPQAQITPTATPTCSPGQFFDPVMNLCRPIQQPCPVGAIDLQGNSVNHGGDDCQPLDVLPEPDDCALLTSNPLNTTEGQVACALPWLIGGTPVIVDSAVGCVDVDRKPYPRTLVNLTDDTTLQLAGLVPSEGLAQPTGTPGWYRITGDWRVQGLYLHERYGDTSAFNTQRLLGGDRYPFPSFNRVTAYLELNALPEQTAWEVPGTPRGVRVVNRAGDRTQLRFDRASFPLPGEGEAISLDGPNREGGNSLPAFRLTVRTRWQARLIIGYETYGVVDNAYRLTGGITRRYTLDLNAGLAQVLADSSTNTYLYGNGRIAQFAGSTVSYFLADHLGSAGTGALDTALP